MEPSRRCLMEYAQRIYQTYTDAPAEAFAIGIGLDALATSMPMKEALDALEYAAQKYLNGNEVE